MSDGRSIAQKIKDELIPSLASGAIGVLASSFFLGIDMKMQIPFGSMSVPAWVAIGGTLTAADMIAYASHDYVLEYIPMIQSFATVENKLLAPVLSGAATYLVLREAVSTDVSLINTFLLGAGSSIAGKYSADTLKSINPAL